MSEIFDINNIYNRTIILIFTSEIFEVDNETISMLASTTV